MEKKTLTGARRRDAMIELCQRSSFSGSFGNLNAQGSPTENQLLNVASNAFRPAPVSGLFRDLPAHSGLFQPWNIHTRHLLMSANRKRRADSRMQHLSQERKDAGASTPITVTPDHTGSRRITPNPE